MATDYDAPRRSEADELAEDSLEELKARRNENQSGVVDVDTDAPDENFELPGADLSGLSGEELTVKVLPKQADEFTWCTTAAGWPRRTEASSSVATAPDRTIRFGHVRRPNKHDWAPTRSGGCPVVCRQADSLVVAPLRSAATSSSGCRVLISQ
jgi:hypothetical protein